MNSHQYLRAVAVCLFAATIAAPAFALSGAIYTTTADCGDVDANRYLWKTDVYLNGGPNNTHAAGLDPGDYWVRVTTPDGNTVLGTSSGTAVTVGSDGRFVQCYQLSAITNYATSPSGAEYKVWLSTTSAFDESESKTDNFRVDNPHIAISKSCTADVFLGDTITETVTVTNTGSIPLTNVSVTDSIGGLLQLPDSYLDTLPFGGSYSWTFTTTAASAGSNDTFASASGFDDAFAYTASSATSCSTHVWTLGVSKTAATSYTRNWQWTLSKTAGASGTVTIAHGSSAPVSFAITATPSALDSGWAVSGSVTVHNPAPIGATVSALDDVLSDSTVVGLQCPGSAPYAIAASGDLVCTYSAGRSGPVNGSNTATATLANNNGGSTQFSGSASYAFGDPTTVLHAVATVTDAGITLANADNSGSAGWTNDSAPASMTLTAPAGGSFPYAANIGNATIACDSYSTASNTAQLFDGEHTLTASASTQLYSGACPGGCTLTIGFWKTHAGFTGRNADRLTQYLAQWLGTAAAAKSVNVTAAPQAVTLLSMSGDASNGVNKLYAQLLAAKLNIARGASPAAVGAAINAADAFLASSNAGDWAALSKTAKNNVNVWASTFDQYNNGLIGPGHCN
jgi:uncharacterized repeat protein (TIGR01451 family)